MPWGQTFIPVWTGVPVWRGLISIVLSVINSEPNNYYGIDRIPACTGSGMYRLHCTTKNLQKQFFLKVHWRRNL